MSLEKLERTKSALKRMMNAADTAHQAMAHAVHRKAATGQPLTETQTYLAQAREGCLISTRTSDLPDLSELHDLVNHVVVDWGWMEDLGITPGGKLESAEEPLVAYQHSIVAMGVLPRLPTHVVTYPGPTRSYADIPVPIRPAKRWGASRKWR